MIWAFGVKGNEYLCKIAVYGKSIKVGNLGV
jgi:hypothetical protein